MYGCDEVMVDYEGKLTPYAQPKEIVLKVGSLGIPIGEKLFITPRVPNPRLEDLDRVSLSIEAALLANYYSYTRLGTQAVKWIILPMVEDPAMVRLVQRLIVKKMRVYQEEFSIPKMDVQLVPLVEDVERLLEIHRFITILYNAVKDYGIEMHNLRVFIGKSDAAVKAGHIASSIGITLALYKTLIVDNELDLDIKPIIGMGMPTFRGGINNPALVEHEVRCYQGFRTVTIQSAIRYDNPFEKYRKVYTVLSDWIDKPARAIDEGIATRIIKDAMSSYSHTPHAT
jgi:phosphoenolpyruvate carboxylase